jgi:hypothetical protein
MARQVGNQPRDEHIADPAEALRRGRRLDAMLAAAMPARPRGVMRATHAEMNRMDDERQRAMARRLNPGRKGPPPESEPVASHATTGAPEAIGDPVELLRR